MSLTGAIVLYSVIWFMVFYIMLQMRFVSQGEAGDVVPGTPRSAPADPQVARKALITSGIALVLWGGIAAVVLSGWVSIQDLDIFNRPGSPATGGTGG